MTIRFAMAAAALALFAATAPASARIGSQQALADIPGAQAQQAHHAPWHTGGRGQHLGWSRQKTKERVVGRAVGRKKLR